MKLAHGTNGNWYIEHVHRGQWALHDREKQIQTIARVDGRSTEILLEQEPGSGGKDSAAISIQGLAGFVVHADRPTGDKVSRAGPLATQAQAGNVYLVEGDWNEAFIDEADLYPGGPFKDQIDAAAGAFNHLALKPAPVKASASGGPAYRTLDRPAPVMPHARELNGSTSRPPRIRRIR